MKVKTINYSESKESITAFGLKSWKKLGMEAEVEENDLLPTSVAVLKEYVKGMIMDEDEVAELANSIGREQKVTPKDERIKSFIATINMCTSRKFLENFRARVNAENNNELTEAFVQKLKTFIEP